MDLTRERLGRNRDAAAWKCDKGRLTFARPAPDNARVISPS